MVADAQTKRYAERCQKIWPAVSGVVYRGRKPGGGARDRRRVTTG